jgi:hypothetical protein
MVADDQRSTLTFSRNNLVFEVGKNVREFTVNNKGVMTLVSPTGRTIDLQKKKGRITISVQAGEAGLWSIKRQSGEFSLQGVMPLIGDSKDYLIQIND